jgi:hypothetical protein
LFRDPSGLGIALPCILGFGTSELLQLSAGEIEELFMINFMFQLGFYAQVRAAPVMGLETCVECRRSIYPASLLFDELAAYRIPMFLRLARSRGAAGPYGPDQGHFEQIDVKQIALGRAALNMCRYCEYLPTKALAGLYLFVASYNVRPYHLFTGN